MNTTEILYLGVKGHVVATDKRDGRVLWKTKLKGGFFSSASEFVTVLLEGDRIYAHTGGELFCLDVASGQQIWKNELEGLGFDIATLTIPGTSVPSVEMVARIQQQKRSDSDNNSNNSST